MPAAGGDDRQMRRLRLAGARRHDRVSNTARQRARRQDYTRQSSGDGEIGGHNVGHGVGLHRVADAERRDHGKQRERRGRWRGCP